MLLKEQFVDPILAQTKIHTLRKERKVQPKIGERLYMYTGLRTKHCFKILDTHTLKSIQHVRVMCTRKKHNKTTGKPGLYIEIFVDHRRLDIDEIKVFAKNDGFEDAAAFAHFWLGKKDRAGAVMQLFNWTDFKY